MTWLHSETKRAIEKDEKLDERSEQLKISEDRHCRPNEASSKK
jgi:hypothetical protein